MLAHDPAKDRLYKPPLKTWSENKGGVAGQAESLGPFPASIVEGGWRIGSRLKQFSPETLFEKINGEAEKFLQQGFTSLYYIILQSGTGEEEMAIELYDQGDSRGSMAVFSEYTAGGKEIKSRGPVSYVMTPAGVIGRKGRFFFRIAGNRESEGVRLKAAQLMEALAGLSEKETESSPGLRYLGRGMNIDPDLISFQGINVFQFDFVRDFWFGRVDPDNPTRLFLHQAGTPEEAVTLFEQIVAEQRYDYDIKEQSHGFAMMQHSFLKTYFAVRHKGPFVYGIEKAPDEAYTMQVLDRFTKVLPNED
jgi:hypothetical protein